VITIRPATSLDSAGIARVQVDSYRSAYAGHFPPAYLERFSYEEQEQDWLRLLADNPGDILLVAEDGRQVITGYCLARAGPENYPGYDAELVALHVQKSAQRDGMGKALMAKAVEALIGRGCQSVMLWTLKGNPIRCWYEQLGGELIDERQMDIDGWEVREVAYGWRSLADLLAATR